MNRKQKIIVSVTGIFLVLLILVGLTYAYFLTQIVGNTNEKSISVTTANLQLLYGDGNGTLTSISKLVPNMTVSEKTFTVTNNGDSTVDAYAVTLEDLKITYANTQGDITAGTITYLEYPNDFKIKITCSSSVKDKTCNGYDGSMPSTNDILLKNSIEKDETHSYSLTLVYEESGIDQSKDMNKTIEAKIDIIDTKGTVDIEGTVTNYSSGDYVQVNSEPKVSYIDKNGKYKVVGMEIDKHTVAIYNGTTNKSSTTLNVEKGDSASVESTTATVTDEIRKITMNINAGNKTYTLSSVGNDATFGTPAYYAQTGELSVGDYVVYNYTPGTYTTTEVDDDNVSQSFDSSSTAAIASDKWRVLSIDNDSVEIMADITLVPKLQMYGAKAYINGPRVLNEMAESLYSGKYGTARSIEVDDINKKVGYNGSRWYNLYTDRGWGNIWRYENVMDKVNEGFAGTITTLGQLMDNSTHALKAIPEKYRTEPDGGQITDNVEVDYYAYATYQHPNDTPQYNNPYANLVIKNYLYVAGGENIEFEMLASQTLESDLAGTFGFTSAIKPYWLANSVRDINLSVTDEENSYIKYGVRQMDKGTVNRTHVWNAKEGAQDADAKRSYGVVPIITLKNDLQVEKNSSGQWTIK